MRLMSLGDFMDLPIQGDRGQILARCFFFFSIAQILKQYGTLEIVLWELGEPMRIPPLPEKTSWHIPNII